MLVGVDAVLFGTSLTFDGVAGVVVIVVTSRLYLRRGVVEGAAAAPPPPHRPEHSPPATPATHAPQPLRPSFVPDAPT